MNKFGFVLGIAIVLSGGAATATTAVGNGEPSGCAGTDIQGRTSETITAIEKSWLESEINGNAAFLDCLLTPDYSVILVKTNKVMTKAELLQRVAGAKPNPGRAMPHLQTKVSVSGDSATAYSWIADAQGEVSASYVDFYRYQGGRWWAAAGVDL